LEELHSQIAHDMRGALIQVLRYAELLKVEHAGHLPPDMENYLARIHANALTMELLISELLKKESKSWQTVARTPLATFVSHGSSS
jgi:light-regulated signal transduction histidine kinase (bacteriophytochrome)